MGNVRIGEYLFELFECATFETGFGIPESFPCSCRRCVLRARSPSFKYPGVEAPLGGLGLLEGRKATYW